MNRIGREVDSRTLALLDHPVHPMSESCREFRFARSGGWRIQEVVLYLMPSYFRTQQAYYLSNVRRHSFRITLKSEIEKYGSGLSRSPAHLKQAAVPRLLPLSIALISWLSM